MLAAQAALIASILPAIAAAAIAGGAALQALSIAGAVVAAGWKGIEQAGERLTARLKGLQSQLESIFRAGLSQEFSKLGEAIRTLDAPIKDIARSIVGVVKEFTGWIRSSQGLREIETMLDGVNNFVKQLGPGAKALAQAFTGFGAAAAPALGDIGKALSSVFENLNKVIQKNKETGQLQKAFENGAKAIEAFGEVLAAIVDIIIDVAAEAGGPATDAVSSFADSLKAAKPFITEVFVELSETAKVIGMVIRVASEILGVIGKVGRAFREAAEAVADFVKDSKALEKIGGVVAVAFAAVTKAVTDGVKKAIQAVKEWWTKTTQDVKDGANKVVQAVKDWWNKTTQDIKTGVQKAVQALKDWAKNTDKEIKDGVKKAIQAVKDWWNKTVQDVKDGVDKAVQAVKDWFSQTVEAIKTGVQEWVDEVKAGWDKIVADVKAGVDKAIEAVKQLPQKVKQALSSWVNDMQKIGKDAVDGIAKGMQSAVSNLVGTATRIAAAAMNAIKGALGIRSPSKVFADEVGAQIPAGIAEGIIRNAGVVTDAMRRAGLTSAQLSVGASASAGAAFAGRGGQQVITLHVAPGGDQAVGVMIQRLAQQGKLKITSNAVVGGRR